MRQLPSIVIALAAGAGACGGGGGADPDLDATTVDATPGDGPTTDAASVDAAPVTDPADPGRWEAIAQDGVAISLGATTVRGSVWSPGMGGAPAAGPFPLVIVSSGFQLARTQYAGYCEHLATWGYVCVTHDYAPSGNHQAKAREVVQIVDWARGPASGLAARIAGQPVAVAGHSLGGKVSINAAILDARIAAVVGWDPVDALPPFGNDGSQSVTPEMMGGLRVPLALLGELGDSGANSCAPAADNFQPYFQAACQAPSRLEVTIAMADHMDWLGNRSTCGLACLVCSNGQTPDATVQRITRRVTTAWLERHLRGQTSADAWLAAPQVGAPTTVRTTAPGC